MSNPVTITDLVLGNPNSTEDVKIKNNFTNIKAWISSPALGSSDISDNAVTSAKIADSAVNTAEIAALAVTDSKLAVGAVTADKIASNVVSRSKMRVFATPKYVTSLPTSWAGTLTAASGATTLTVSSTASGSFTVGTLVSLVSGSGLPSDTVVTDVGSGTITVNRATTAVLSGANATAVPQSGDEVHYAADSATGALWHLRYRSVADGGNATYPWEFIGGGPVRATSQSGQTTSSNWLFLSSPLMNVPLAGDYDLELSATLQTTTGSVGNVGSIMALTWPTKLTNATGITSVATSMTVTNASAIPSVATYALVDSEIVQITANAAGTLTIVRAQQGTTAASHAVNAPVFVIPSPYAGGGDLSGIVSLGYSSSTAGEIWGGGTKLFRFTGLEASATQVPRVAWRVSSAAGTGSYWALSVIARPVRVG